MKKTLFALMMAASTLSSGAFAQATPPAPGMAPPPPRGPMMHPGPDRGGPERDRTVTRAEFLAEAAQHFDAMDTDHDGTVTGRERMAFREAMHDRQIAAGGKSPPPPPHAGDRKPMGRRGGGERVETRDEAMARAAERFDRMDTNHDGKIDPAERAAMRPMGPGAWGAHADGAAPPPPPPAQ